MVIAQRRAGVFQGFALSDLLADFGFYRFDLTGARGNFCGAGTRHDDHAVGVGHDDVAGAHTGAADGHGLIHRLHLHAVFAGAHKTPFAEHRVAVMQGFADIPANPVDDRGGDGPAACVLGHDVAPDRAVGAPAVIDHHHVAGGYVINKVAHRPRRNAGRNVLHGECRPHNHLGVVGQGGDAQALAGQAEFVQGIRDAGGVQPFKQGYQLLIIHCACSALMASN